MERPGVSLLDLQRRSQGRLNIVDETGPTTLDLQLRNGNWSGGLWQDGQSSSVRRSQIFLRFGQGFFGRLLFHFAYRVIASAPCHRKRTGRVTKSLRRSSDSSSSRPLLPVTPPDHPKSHFDTICLFEPSCNHPLVENTITHDQDPYDVSDTVRTTVVVVVRRV